MNRFTLPQWLPAHQFEYSHWQEVPAEKLEKIRAGLARFQTDKPLVSIVIPVWNEGKNILRTLSSFSSMDLPYPTELLIVNNNSTDDTQEILDYLGVKYLLETRQGIAHARLAGLRASRGTYQLCGDGDSLYPPQWITYMLAPLMLNQQVTCVYGNYSFIPHGELVRWKLGVYELFAECLFEFRKLKREFLNVRGANFGFRTRQGLAIKGFEMTVTRVYDNDEKSGSYVVLGEDGRMGRKLGELGKIQIVRTHKARIWTSSRRLLKDGSLFGAYTCRVKHELGRLYDYFLGPEKVTHTTDNLQP
jgi:hypothetical protein